MCWQISRDLPVAEAPRQCTVRVIPLDRQEERRTRQTDPTEAIYTCIDFRQLNALTVKDRYNLPNLESCFHMRDAKVLSKIDLRSAFWQIPINWNDMNKTGFYVGNKIYYWRKMPFWTHQRTSQYAAPYGQVLR